MIYFYYGPDSFRSKEMVHQLKDKFIQVYDPSGHNVEFLDSSEFSLEKFFTSVKGGGLLSVKKCVIIKNIFDIKKFADSQEPILSYLKTLKNSKDESYLIFWQEGTPRSNLKLFKFLIETCTPLNCCREFEQLEGKALTSWVQQQTKKFGKTIDAPTAQALVALVGNNTWHVHQEIRKLCFATAAPAINLKELENLVSATAGDVMFPFLDALGMRSSQQALVYLEQLLRDAELPHLVAMVIRQYRLIAQYKETAAELRNSYGVSQKLKLPPFILKKIEQQASRYTKAELRHIYRELVLLDNLQKSDPHKAGIALTLLVAKL